MTESPREFGSTLERELARTEDNWSRWITPGTTLLLEHDGEPRGLVAGVAHDANPQDAFLMAMWVHPQSRGTGGGDALVRGLLDWAREAGYHKVLLHVVKENVHASGLYARNGFVPVGEVTRERDAVVEVEMHWEVPRL